jgi:hypothetical protein
MAEKRKINWFFKFIAFLSFTFILAPMIVIVIVSFNAGEGIMFPPQGFSCGGTPISSPKTPNSYPGSSIASRWPFRHVV